MMEMGQINKALQQRERLKVEIGEMLLEMRDITANPMAAMGAIAVLPEVIDKYAEVQRINDWIIVELVRQYGPVGNMPALEG